MKRAWISISVFLGLALLGLAGAHADTWQNPEGTTSITVNKSGTYELQLRALGFCDDNWFEASLLALRGADGLYALADIQSVRTSEFWHDGVQDLRG